MRLNGRRRTTFSRCLMTGAAVAALATAAAAEDWPQWRGPNRNGQTAETGVLGLWPVGAAPKVAWRAEVGKGHSSVSIANGLAYTMGWDGARDTVFCFDARTGRLQWKQSYPCATIVQWPGPRATPTVDGGQVYTLGQHGQLRAWNARTGVPAWSVQLAAAYSPDVDYGFAWSPLVQGEHLILGTGNRGLAIRKRDGAFAWGNDGRPGACASAVPFEHQGVRGVVMLSTDAPRENVALVGVEPTTGRELWRSAPWPEKWGAACVDPLVAGGKIFITTAEQLSRCARFSIGPNGLWQDWSNTNLCSYTGCSVLIGDHLYGINRQGRLKCLDWNTGVEKWSQAGFDSHGSLISAEGRLILQSSRQGELAIAQALPTGYEELRRVKIFTGDAHTFTPPSLANGRIYCRSYAGEVVCLETGGERPQAAMPSLFSLPSSCGDPCPDETGTPAVRHGQAVLPRPWSRPAHTICEILLTPTRPPRHRRPTGLSQGIRVSF